MGGQPLSNIGTDRRLGYFNRAAVAAPFGAWGRSAIYGLPLRRTNLVPAINEGARLTFRGEFDNKFHRTNFAGPDVNLANATIGRVGSTLDPRFVQLALPLSF